MYLSLLFSFFSPISLFVLLGSMSHWLMKHYNKSWCITIALYLLLVLPQNCVLAISWRRQWHPTPVLLPVKSHGRRSLVGYSPLGCEESDTTEWLHFHFSLSCTGEGNGNPLQCSCLENPRDGGAWWAAVYGVAQSRTRLKRRSSSSTLLLECNSLSWLVIMKCHSSSLAV